MIPGQRERISSYHAHRSEQYINSETHVCPVIEGKISGPIVHDRDPLDPPMAIRRVYPAIAQVEPSRERHDVGYQWSFFHAAMAQIKREGIFLSTRGTKHCVLAGDDHVADRQLV